MATEITDVTPYVAPEGTCLVTVETDDGTLGIGASGLGRRGHAVAEAIEAMTPGLLGEDPSRIEHLWQVLFRGGFFPGGVIQSAAVSALDIALWDLNGKRLGVPVYELLGGRTRDSVRCYPHMSDRGSIESLVEECLEKQAAGWEFARWGVTDPADESILEPDRAARYAIDQVEAVREACGEEFNICIDVHTRLDPPSASKLCRGVEPFEPFFVEDPLRVEYPGKLERLRSQTSVPIAVGEQFDSKWAFQEVIEEELADYCRLDVTIVGGLTEARKIAGWCETHYVPLTPHNPGNLGPVATAATLHLCLASPMVGVMELAAPPMTTQTERFPEQVPFEEGRLHPPDGPGLGIEVDLEALEEMTPASPKEPYGYRRDDGAYTNW